LIGTLLAGLAGALQAHANDTEVSGVTADHSKFEILQQDFKSGPEVTEACISCHTEASGQVMQSLHWTWSFDNEKTGQKLGKRHLVNAFCGTVASNEPRCTSCHAGYDWVDMNEDPPAQENNVDCLVCHDTTGSYKKWPTAAGHPLYESVTKGGKTHMPPDLQTIARQVGMPTRENCGSCHFYGGGADNVKHGDLSSALVSPSHVVDVHMAKNGLDFNCTACHVSHSHQWAGSRYAVHATDPEGTGKPGMRRDVATCESCHGNAPHPQDSLDGIKLNNHVDRVACQTCHIPEFAKGGVATKTRWDWSTAGKLKDGKPYHEDNYIQSDGRHLHTYMSEKGDFDYGENVVPHYAWFDGQIRYTLPSEKIDPEQIVKINHFAGSADDADARIWPFKQMEGRQPYDKVNHTLVYSHVWGPDTDTAFWTNFDWSKAIGAGMQAAGLDFSGEHGFVDTYMYWPITHMVAPKEQALSCESCHSKGGRLEQIEGVYIPGRDETPWLDRAMLWILAAVLLGIFGHTLIRVLFGRKGNHRGEH
jgi:octaheme c-type cytochrome (tetrathionate reductase family)